MEIIIMLDVMVTLAFSRPLSEQSFNFYSMFGSERKNKQHKKITFTTVHSRPFTNY